jgi:hypothetical protein
MSLDVATLSGTLTWMLSKANPGFSDTKQSGSASQTITYPVATINQMVAKVLTIAASGTATIDLSSNIDLVGDAVAMTKAVALYIASTGSNIKVTGHGTNGLSTWFLQASGELHVRTGGFAIVGWPSTLPATVDATHKILTITNLSATTATTVTYAILGGS